MYQLFTDTQIITKIQDRLPESFQLAELECSRAGKVGMEVGSLRERIIVALLIYYFGRENVQTEIPITEHETDVIVHDLPISIKTITGKGLGGIKLIWTVDADKALEFSENYEPQTDMLFIHINWDNIGGMYYIPIEVQKEVLLKVGNENYMKLPKLGTNPRGIEMKGTAMEMLISHPKTSCIKINWLKSEIHFDTFERWVDYWSL